MSSEVVYEGWIGRRQIGRSFVRMRYFVLESRLLSTTTRETLKIIRWDYSFQYGKLSGGGR
ncbi:PH domain-like [Trema orientale]|uniref:PH domain-like n=1 Tax=Trema orientale TaxID=63057 RepID=A0A2P5B3F2_TREOI|nr:PH domain-like [Trema orientale]